MSGVTFTSLYVLENNEIAPLLTLDVEAVGGAEDRGLGVQGAGVLAPVTPPDWSTLVISPPITAHLATLDQSEASTGLYQPIQAHLSPRTVRVTPWPPGAEATPSRESCSTLKVSAEIT